MAPQIREKVTKGAVQAMAGDAFESSLLQKEMFWEKKFADRGGRLMAGIDPTGAGRVIPGYADRIVPELLMEAGFTLPQAIKICSLNAAQYLGRDAEIGTIAAGKKADMVLIGGDLEADIKNMRKTEIVFKDGVGWNSSRILESVKGMVGLH